MPLPLPDPQLPPNPKDALQSIQRNFEALAQSFVLPVPTGTVLPFSGATAPTGYLICDGSEKAVADYPALSEILETTFGSKTNGLGGSGTSHFRLPNLKGRVPVGRDSSDADFDTLGETRGSKTHTLTISEMPAHDHSLGNVLFNTASPTFFAFGASYGQNVASTSGSTGGGGAHNNIQPSIVLNYIIKT